MVAGETIERSIDAACGKQEWGIYFPSQAVTWGEKERRCALQVTLQQTAPGEKKKNRAHHPPQSAVASSLLLSIAAATAYNNNKHCCWWCRGIERTKNILSTTTTSATRDFRGGGTPFYMLVGLELEPFRILPLTLISSQRTTPVSDTGRECVKVKKVT